MDISNYFDSTKDIVNKKRKAIDDENKQKFFNICNIAIKNLKETSQIAVKEGPWGEIKTKQWLYFCIFGTEAKTLSIIFWNFVLAHHK